MWTMLQAIKLMQSKRLNQSIERYSHDDQNAFSEKLTSSDTDEVFSQYHMVWR